MDGRKLDRKQRGEKVEKKIRKGNEGKAGKKAKGGEVYVNATARCQYAMFEKKCSILLRAISVAVRQCFDLLKTKAFFHI